MQSLKNQVVFTIAYSNVFKQPLTTAEVYKRLMSFFGSEPITTVELERTLAQLVKDNNLSKKSGYWQLASLSEDLAVIRARRENLSEKKIAELAPFLSFIQCLPWVIGVAITGSVALLNAEEKDDVDLMIVTSNHRLWLVRPLLVLFSFLQGKRRSWNHEEENSWCLNLWLEEQSLAVPLQRHNFYTAYEVVQALWVVDKHQVARQFLHKNNWVLQYLPEYYAQQLAVVGRTSSSQSRVFGLTQLLSGVNELAYQLQRLYMKRHMTREKVSRSAAFFHPRDTKKQIIQHLTALIRSSSFSRKELPH